MCLLKASYIHLELWSKYKRTTTAAKKRMRGYLKAFHNLEPLVNVSVCVVGPTGYDTSEPLVLDGEDPCPHCHLSPCVIARPPSWLRGGAASAHLSNITKRFKLYGKLLGHLGVWNHPLYMEYKRTKTAIHDKRDVMPDCVIGVSHNIISETENCNNEIATFKGSERSLP